MTRKIVLTSKFVARAKQKRARDALKLIFSSYGTSWAKQKQRCVASVRSKEVCPRAFVHFSVSQFHKKSALVFSIFLERVPSRVRSFLGFSVLKDDKSVPSRVRSFFSFSVL